MAFRIDLLARRTGWTRKGQDRDADGNLELVVKFSRSELGYWLAQLHPDNDFAGLLLTWETLVDFCGSDFVDPCPSSYPTIMRIID